ncbi:hypothetical protein PR003_g262 [Phytophthora rubi]|uniref:Cardiolipin synthase N-terminal domain-containing protein n=1 Tax=Phytophthora rubi TaxID=129364 RepID=A0A6A3PJ90_9STRA|nr:hypothetical protein PR001_g163 [Phytophthora rubi]KAE9360347.1 hypothetical protein PR003_g262 [Phytophthora rubi]
MKILSVFAALHALATPAHAKSNSSVSSLEELWMFIAVVYAAVLVPLLGYFLYSLVSDPATGQVLTVMWARAKQRMLAFLGPRPRSTAIRHERQPVSRAATAAETKKTR